MLRDMFAGLCSRAEWRAHIIQSLRLKRLGIFMDVCKRNFIHSLSLSSLNIFSLLYRTPRFNVNGIGQSIMRLMKSDVFEIPGDVASFRVN